MNLSHGTFWLGAACLLRCLVFANVALATQPPITAVAFAPGGASLVAVSQAGLHEFSWPNLARQRTVALATPNLFCLTFSPNKKQLAVGGGFPSEVGVVEVFSWPRLESFVRFDDHDDSVRALAWTPDARLVAASIDREISLLDVEVGNQGDDPVTLSGHSRGVDAVCLLSDGKTIVTAGLDQSVRVWDLGSAKLTRSLKQHTKPVHALAVRPGDHDLPMVASASGDRTIRFWQPTIGRMVRYVRLDAEPLNIAWCDSSRIAASCVDGQVRIVDADQVQVIETVSAINGWAYALAVHPLDGSLVVGGSDGRLRRIELRP